MRKEFLPFSRPSIDEADIAAVGEVLRSGWITTGPKNAEFEEKFCDYTGCDQAVALSSATAGMHLALKALGIGPGDEVITPSMTWVSTVNLIVLSGAKPVFVDVDRDTLMTTAELIQERLSERTRLIVPVHFAGAPVDMEPVRKIAAGRNLHIIEDAAHAVGTECRGQKIGKNGPSIFSFHPIKNITSGEGGMFCSDNLDLVDRIRRLKFHGLGLDAYDRQTQGRSPQAQVLEPGFKYNLPDILAVLGMRQLARVEDFNARRTQLAMHYRERLAEMDEIRPLAIPSYPHKHSWHLFIIRLDAHPSKLSRNDFMEELKRRNIGTGLHFRAVHQQKYYRETMKAPSGGLPNTEWNSERICSLPLFPGMTHGDVDDVVDTIKEILIS
ncbi:MAG: UDP-4-amino-4-deoxy-L-arabinose aminotransferase [Deltaproteobacteria bacterium]|nr:UDP-4-amino-4-deoxy-L-arabinose aminotransferase [Deltaproteobacteria bacterium]MBW2197239.1 UDP-4-amino-4-deoxy-L-arabinose aminotransferase [Deltaproteobacteria bacterium]MBW2325659.1 UDP-4-amino-4-deoxy-L-arabinose aminotransferase [Deltaproteobacteria bacterium]